MYPDKLVSKIFKARYFPNGSFLNAKIGGNPSFIWRSILEAQSVLKQGVACRIWSGHNVNVLEDPWLPSDNDPYVHTSSEALLHKQVSSLMITGERQWDVDLIKDIFEDRDANMIISIPLSNVENDTWYWHREKLGHYSVKSAYTLIQDGKDNNHTGDNSGFWRQMWNLKIPPKVKNFLWRAITGCLPTKDLLRMRRVDVNGLCPSCNIVPESILHTFVTCSFAEACWLNTVIPVISGAFNSFVDWLQLVFQQRSSAEIRTIAMVCWMLWKCQNDLVWNQHSMEVAEVVNSARSVLDQWQSVQDRTFDSFLGYMTQEDGHEHWRHPTFGRVKINTDAAIFGPSNSYSHALVVRNHSGDLIEAMSRCVQGNISPDLAEAIGIREALSWVKKQNQSDVKIETDCLQVVQAICSSFASLSYMGRVIDECRNLLIDLKDRNVIIRFVKRSANRVAHYLARYSCSVADRNWRVGDVHPEFHYVMLSDSRDQ